jgi:23S rRNA (adenine2503-C2)-methyltransferase
MKHRINLVGKTSTEICDIVGPHVDRGFRGKQVANWVRDRDAREFEEMSNLPKEMRENLGEVFEILEPKVEDIVTSGDGTKKFLFRFEDNAAVEGVMMPLERKTTFCLSSQAGCAVGCAFCVTGMLGAGRNLTADEIFGQLRVMMRHGASSSDRINIVFMGMGEPLLNTSHLGKTLEVMYENISPKRITVSTSGILPGLRWLASLPKRPKLAISLNACTQELRERIMPMTKVHRLDDLMAELRSFPLEKGRRITFEYVLIKNINDSTDEARRVGPLLGGIPCKVNIIPLNEDPKHLPDLQTPDEATIDDFARILRDAGLVVTVRRSRGRDLAGACGQLRGRR